MVAGFNKKENGEFFNNALLFKTVGIIFLIGILVLIVADIKIYQKKQELSDQVSAYQKQIEDIKKSSQTLKEEIANANSVDYLEKLGYEQFDQTRPGETEYMFVRQQEKTETTANASNPWFGWLAVAWAWIKGKF